MTYENSQRETSIENAHEQGMADEKTLEKNHQETMADLEQKKKVAAKNYADHHSKNTKAEDALRKDYKKASNSYKENMNQYDVELKNGTKDNENT